MIINAQQALKAAQAQAAAEGETEEEAANDFKFIINDFPQQVGLT